MDRRRGAWLLGGGLGALGAAARWRGLFGLPGACRRLDDLAAAQAAGADRHAAHAAVDQGADALQVRLPGARGHVVRVTHVLAEHRALAADVTLLGHEVLFSIRPRPVSRAAHPSTSTRRRKPGRE